MDYRELKGRLHDNNKLSYIKEDDVESWEGRCIWMELNNIIFFYNVNGLNLKNKKTLIIFLEGGQVVDIEIKYIESLEF